MRPKDAANRLVNIFHHPGYWESGQSRCIVGALECTGAKARWDRFSSTPKGNKKKNGAGNGNRRYIPVFCFSLWSENVSEKQTLSSDAVNFVQLTWETSLSRRDSNNLERRLPNCCWLSIDIYTRYFFKRNTHDMCQPLIIFLDCENNSLIVYLDTYYITQINNARQTM